MVSLRFSGGRSRTFIGLIGIASVLLLALLVSPFVVPPKVHAVKHAVLHAVTIPNDQTPFRRETGAELELMLNDIASNQGESIALPFLRARDQRAGLVKFVYSITLDEKTLGVDRPFSGRDASARDDKLGLLYVQIINGGDFYLNGQWVAGLDRSTKEDRRMWYEPFVVPLPSHLLKTDGTPNVLTVSQSTQESFISIQRIYFGEIRELNRVFGVVDFISSTLADAFKVLGFAAGLFLLVIWAVSPNERIYAVAGGASILWAVLFLLFRMQESSTDMQWLWRWLVYAAQGGVISLMTLLIFSFINRPLGKWGTCCVFVVSGIPAVVYAIGGVPTLRYLNLLWPPVVLLTYGWAIALLIGYWWRTRSVPAGLFLLQAAVFLILAVYGFAVQVRLIDKLSNSGLEAGWSGLVFEHILVLFLGMPIMLLAAGYMLVVKYRDKVIELKHSQLFMEQRENELEEIHQKRELIALSEATLLERERIYQDIHDGIGSQLVKAIFSLRSNGTDSAAVVDNLQACLQDLRLVIDGPPESDVDLQTTVFAFCVTQELHLEGSGLAISYHVGLESTIYTDPKVSLNVLRVLQESLNNTIKHAGATYIDVDLKSSGSHLILTITDDGHADRRSPHQTLAQQSEFGSSGNRGVTGLSLRAADIGAKYTINITKSGTTVRLSIPIPGADKAKVSSQPSQLEFV